MDTDVKKIIADLADIKSELHEIKENMPSKDMFLSTEEAKLLKESFRNEKKGELVSSKELKKELGL